MDFGFQESNETMSFICSIPFVKRLIRENKKLKKKNRELKQLVKLITKNFDLFQDDETDTPIEIIGAPIKLEKNDLEFEDLDDEVLIIDPPANIHCDIHEIESDDTEVVNPSPEHQMEPTKSVLNKKNYDDDSCSFNSILGAVKTVEDYDKLTIFYKKLWLQNNSLDSLEKNATKCAECYNVVTNRLRHHGLCTICFSNRDCEAKISKSKDEVVVEEDEEQVVEEDEEEEVEEVVEEDEVEEVVEEDEEVVEEDEEEVVEEDEEEEEVVVEEDEEDEEEEVVVEEDEEDEEDVYEIVINKKTYYTTDMKNGIIYDTDENGEISVEVGKLVNGVHKLNKKKK